MLDLAALNTETMLAQAQGVLSPPQLAKFRQAEAQRLEQRRLEEKIRAERNAAAANAPGS